MTKLVIDLILLGDFFYLPEFKSQEELEEYAREKVSANFDCEDDIYCWIDQWKIDHKFSIISDTISSYDLEDMTAEKVVVFTLEDKYYKTYYKESYMWENELTVEPFEVVPVEKTIIEYLRKE